VPKKKLYDELLQIEKQLLDLAKRQRKQPRVRFWDGNVSAFVDIEDTTRLDLLIASLVAA
jgi:hypothetical protein